MSGQTSHTAGGIPVTAIVGPTAGGKTALGVAMAERFGGEIVSADAMQVYRGMDIATAKPSPEELSAVRHHMVGVLAPGEAFSVARYVEMASACIAEITGRGKLPFVVGGTGLYIDSLLENIRFAEEPDTAELRRTLQKRLAEEGAEALFAELSAADPEAAQKIHVNNTTRLIRALEVYYATGETLTRRKRESRCAPSPYDTLYIGLRFQNRDELYERIDRRVDAMFAAGLEDEVRMLAADTGKTAVQAIGVKEMLPYFEGKITLDDARSAIKLATRHYAKRQLTWFGRNERIHWLFADSPACPPEAEAAKLIETHMEGRS